jgi:succinyl-CoA synthetase beta subunit
LKEPEENMDIHEFQAKLILQKYGIPTPPFFVCSSIEEVEKLVQVYHLDAAVLKVQVHAGGRGKAGGVRFARTRDEILEEARALLGKKIVNNQTGARGLIAHQILMTLPISILKEFYLSLVIDRRKAQTILIASPVGGMDIEEIAEKNPEKILKIPLASEGGLKSYHLLRIMKFMGWNKELQKQGAAILNALVKMFNETDATLVEINPLVETSDQELLALDAKLAIDDNALFRHPELQLFFDPTQMHPSEARAYQHGLAYVALDGNIGCMVNGAGLAMATMDIIHYYGGSPANFLDVGGGASKEKVAEGFKIILSDPHVKAILVNIFGGIMNCATLAEGIVAAGNELKIHVPLIVRMEGTHVEQGREILERAQLNIKVANSLNEAAQQAVRIASSFKNGKEPYVNSSE